MRPIYFDYSATTPVDPRVVDKMVPWLYERAGNPASRSHAYGWEAEEAVEHARAQVASLVNADPREIVWTSGATESNKVLRAFMQSAASTSLRLKPSTKLF
jgi:cysteine desulfurase